MELMKVLFGLLFVLVIGCYNEAIAEIEVVNYNMIHLSVENGLSHNTIRKVYQDQEGVVWIGTEDGLNRYNGAEISKYFHSPNDDTSLPSAKINDIYQDRIGQMWVGTTKGLCLYVPEIDGFKRFDNISEFGCNEILEDQNGTVWLATRRGLYFYLQEYDRFERLLFSSFGTKKLDNASIYKIKEINDSEFLLSTSTGLFVFNYAEKSLSRITTANIKDKGRILLSFIYKDKDGIVWIGNKGGGLYQLERKDNSFSLNEVYKDLLGSIPLRDFVQDKSDNIWIATYGGIYIIDALGNIKLIKPDSSNPSGLSYLSTTKLLVDRDQSVWIGTSYGGVNIYRKRNNVFRNIWMRYNDAGMTSSAIWGITKVDDDKLWIGTQGSGIAVYDERGGTISRFKQTPLKNANIHGFCNDGAGGVFIGTHRKGIYHYEFRTKRLQKLNVGPDNLDVATMHRDTQGNIWVGAFNAKPIVLHKLGGRYVEKEMPWKTYDIKRLTSIGEDQEGRIYCSGAKKLLVYDPSSGRFSAYVGGIDLEEVQQLSSSRILCYYEDSHRNMWIGTMGSGLIRLTEKRDSFQIYTVHDGLVNNTIYGILEKEDRLWISTNAGLMTFDKDFKQHKTYDIADGLPTNQFTVDATYQQDGNLYFGSIKGVTFFNPEELADDTTNFKIGIDDIKVLNKSVRYELQKGQYLKMQNGWQELNLSHRESAISFKFLSYFYGAPGKLEYRYRLNGFDKQWKRTKTGIASYSNLLPGEYRFEVKVANPDGYWSNKVATVSFKINPPWWKTWWAYTGYIVVVIGLILLSRNIMHERIRAKEKLRLAEMEKAQEKALAQLKLNIFTNISHDFRTPLSLISGPIDELYEGEQDHKKKKLLEITRRNAARLLNLINTILDFRKAEHGALVLNSEEVNVREFIDAQLVAFSEVAERKGIHVKTKFDPSVTMWNFDWLKMSSVIYNLLGNAIKFSEKGDQICVYVCDGVEELCIDVEDSGRGIPKEQIEHVFDQFYQVHPTDESKLKGSGIGLALTKELIELHNGTITVKSDDAGGTTFKIRLPRLTGDTVIPTIHDIPDYSYEVEPVQETQSTVENSLPVLLLVDDSVDLRAFLADALSAQYNVLTAEDGQQGLDILTKERVDLIISDVMMPVMDGFEFCSRVKNDINTSHIPFVLLTAKDSDEDGIKGMEIGADVYLAKPFKMRFLRAQLANLDKLRGQLHNQFKQVETIEAAELKLNDVDRQFIEQVIDVIHANLDNPEVSTEFLATELGLSRSTLYRKITSIAGKGSKEFIRYIRLQKAAELLKNSNITISEVAYQVGFSTPSYFASSFKKEFGILPKEYQENNA
ncbi:hybrid sensor histidine kinase/response regulator [Puteibacter caeruleilacunae]|nr:hybrid sensor histidine kinase/response regulator [Puteibacter caeruleilacunae]